MPNPYTHPNGTTITNLDGTVLSIESESGYFALTKDETDATTLAEVGIAQAEATLALVEQQKVANLIALLKETFASHQALEALSDIATAKFGEQIGLRPEVAAALGIKAAGHD